MSTAELEVEALDEAATNIPTTTRDLALDATYEIEVLVNMLDSQRVELRCEEWEGDDMSLQILLSTTLRRIKSLNGFLMEAVGESLDRPADAVFVERVRGTT